jgi:very-long-chain enoyl-CoA reductase
MAGKNIIKLSSRSTKKPIKNLPSSLEITTDTTIEDLKKSIAQHVNLKDYNRIGLFSPATNKTVKNRLAKVTELGLDELKVQDLGPQMDWTTVYVIEYMGPIIFHVVIPYLRPYIYPFASAESLSKPFSSTQNLAWYMIIGHFLKREYETLFVHRFSANTMPARNIFKNSAFYWLLSGLLTAYTVYAPDSLAATANQPLMDIIGTVLFLFGEISNAYAHHYLSTLRTKGGTERKIPTGYGFDLVTCPNYMFEVLSWLGIIVATRSWACAIFIASGIYQMQEWAKGKEMAYRTEFGDKYKKKRYTMLPGLM